MYVPKGKSAAYTESGVFDFPVGSVLIKTFAFAPDMRDPALNEKWIETRLLASGPRTNPWFQECGPRLIQNNEIVAFDTDLIGCYGICIDISRTWWVGDARPTNAMVSAMHIFLNPPVSPYLWSR